MIRRTVTAALGLVLTLTANDAFGQSRVAPPRPSATDQRSAPQICGSRDPRRFPQDCSGQYAEPAQSFEDRQTPSRDEPPAPERDERAPTTAFSQSPPSALRRTTGGLNQWMYVQVLSANCRAAPSTDADRLGRVARNEHVAVIDHEGGWSLVRRVTDCWVSDDLLSASRYMTAAVAQPAHPAPRQRARPRPSAGSVSFQNCSAARTAGAADRLSTAESDFGVKAVSSGPKSRSVRGPTA